MIVDAHHHLWDLTVRDQPWISGEELAPLRRSFGIEDLRAATAVTEVAKTVVVQTVGVPEETPELLATAAGSGGLIAGVVGWLDLTAPGVAEDIEELRAQPGGHLLAGIRHQVQSEPDPDWLNRPDVRRGLAALAAAGLVYDLVVTPAQLPAATRAAAALPELTFVLDHLGKPPIATGAIRPWTEAVRELASLPNTVCKLSGMVTEADWAGWTTDDLRPYADTVIQTFGPDRLMFGSDWPVCLLAARYDDVLTTAHELTSQLSTTERQAVFAQTAKRVYGL